MAMVCPQCNSGFAQRLRCPQCDVRLVFQERRRAGRGRWSPGGWQQSPWGRILIGLLLAQGLYYGLRHLCVAGLLATGWVDSETLWTSVPGLLLLQGLQIVSLFIGGIFTGAGQRQGPAYGAVLGVWNGVFLVLVQPDQARMLSPVTLYGQPVLQAVLGALAGWVGSQIWKPLSAALDPEAPRKPAAVARRKSVNLFEGPIAWGRVLVGTSLAVAGTLSADGILDLVISASNNALSLSTNLQARLLTWEIIAVAMLVGSAVAGAGTSNGYKQGLVVGAATAVVLFGIRLGDSVSSMELLIVGMGAPVILGIGGGGFGSQLLPPVQRRRYRAA